ncbi:MAG: cyclic nucleotide-binding domain-containing protein [Proteobacteria bacterium]|nr:cyclic nucleotide-binding domain-containing protein [Pseudomonadota bacterium]
MIDAERYRELDAVEKDADFMGKLTQRLSVGTSVFGRYNADDIPKIANYMEAYRASTGSAVFVEGHQAGYLCIVLDGGLDVVKETKLGRSRKITDVCPGTTIGEMSIIDGQPHSATAVASCPSLLAVLSKENLLRLVDEEPRLGAKMLANIAELLSMRLRKTNDMLIDYLN